MVIAFNSPQDRFGLQEGLGALAQTMAATNLHNRQQKALMAAEARGETRQIGAEQRAQQRQIAEEQRGQALKSRYGGILGSLLEKYQGAGQALTGDNLNKFISEATQAGLPIEYLKDLKELQRPVQTPFTGAIQKENVDYINNTVQSGRLAEDLLSRAPSVENLLDNTTSYTNPLIRNVKNFAGFKNEEDQQIFNYGQEVAQAISDIKGIKPSQATMKWAQGLTISPANSPEVNKANLANTTRLLKIAAESKRVVQTLVDQYQRSGVEPPANFQSIVDQAIEPYRREIDQLAASNDVLSAQFSEGEILDKIPDAKQYTGAEIEDSKGAKYVSDGKTWKKVK